MEEGKCQNKNKQKKKTGQKFGLISLDSIQKRYCDSFNLINAKLMP